MRHRLLLAALAVASAGGLRPALKHIRMTASVTPPAASSSKQLSVAIAGGVCLGSSVRFTQGAYSCNQPAIVQVSELAEALSETANGMPSLDSERGRGLFLLSVYLEDLRAEPAPQGGLRLSGRIQRQ